MGINEIGKEAFDSMTDKPSGTDKSIQNMLDKVPGGIIMYEWTGKQLKTLHINQQYAQQYGTSLVSEGANDGGPDFMRVHPDDRETYQKACIEAVTKTHHLNYIYRVWNDEANRYLWTKIDAVSEDLPDGKALVYAIYTDVTEQKDAEARAIETYKSYVDTLMRINKDAIATFHVNLTKNLCENAVSSYWNIRKLNENGTLDGTFTEAEKMIENKTERGKFRETFARENLYAQYNQGNSHISLKHRYLLEENRTEWLETIIELVKNPDTGDIEGTIFSKNINSETTESIIVNEMLKKDYLKLAVLYLDMEDYYLYNYDEGLNGMHRRDFWSNGLQDIIKMAAAHELVQFDKNVTKENVFHQLSLSTEYAVTFDGKTQGRRYQLRFSLPSPDSIMALATLRDITDDALLERLKYEAEHDELTGLFNRKKAYEECEKLLKMYPDEKFIMVHFDLQRFRLYNTFFGEKEGDRLLKYLGEMFKGLLPTHKYGVFGRIEADEFLLFFPYHENVIEENEIFIHNKLISYREDFVVSGSCGVYSITDKTISVDEMYNRASIASKNNKKRQLQKVNFFDEKMAERIIWEQHIIKEMKHAVEEKQFVVYLQPKYVLISGEPFGAEALVRWQHPVHGLVPPNRFIPLFESNGFITTLDQYMWESVCQLLRKWIDAGYNPMPISVNVSRVSMYSPRIVSVIENLIKKYDIHPSLLNLELTESAYMDDPEEMKNRLKALQEKGFKIMMDDFGTGYSSLNTLREIPVDYLKVDRKFLASIDQDERSREVLSSVIHMAIRMGIPVITEGVETNEQRDFLETIGCDYAQGFLYCKPVPVATYEEEILIKHLSYHYSDIHDKMELSQETLTMDSQVNKFASLMPYPIAFVDFIAESYTYMSFNHLFTEQFGSIREIEHGNADFKRDLQATYEKVAKTQVPAECFITKKDMNGILRYYTVRVQYIGKNALSSILLSTFIDLTEFCMNTTPLSTDENLINAKQNVYTLQEMTRYVHMLNQTFDVARLVKPEAMQVVNADGNYKPKCENGSCHSFWGKSERCNNCTTLQCSMTGRNMYKIEKRNQDFYLVASHPVKISLGEDKTVTDYVVETLTKLTEEIIKILVSKDATLNGQVDELMKLVYKDDLTSCYNRRYFNETRYMNNSDFQKNGGIPVAFLLLDLNNFKKINDRYGHATGDYVLIKVAEELKSNSSAYESVIRYGGDEFLIILTNCREDDLPGRIKSFKKQVSFVSYGETEKQEMSCEIGYSFCENFLGSATQVEKLLTDADHMMYEGKMKKNLSRK